MIYFLVFCLIMITDIIELFKSWRYYTKKSKSIFKKQVIYGLSIIFLIQGLGVLFSLKQKEILYLMAGVIVSGLLVFRYHLLYLEQKHQFNLISQFMLKTCIFYRIHQKIYPTILELRNEENIKLTLKIDKIIEQIELGYSIGPSMLDITNHYLMQSLIQVIESAESLGYNHIENQLIRLEEDIESWIFQTRMYDQEEKQYRHRMLLLLLMSILIAYFAQNMLMKSVEIQNLDFYQHLILFFLFSVNLCILWIFRRLKGSWFLKEELI